MASYAQQNKVTHAGVAVNNWAGDFECSVCRRKRLTASEFSKKMQERYKKDGNGALKCKICVDKAAADERAAAQAARGVFSTGTLRPKSRYQKWRIWQSCPQQFGVFRPGGTGNDAKR